MKITLRLIISLILISVLVAGIFTYVQVENEKTRLEHELEMRAAILAESMHESIKGILISGSLKKLNLFVNRFAAREKLLGIAVYDSLGKYLAASNKSFRALPDSVSSVAESIVNNKTIAAFRAFEKRNLFLYTKPIVSDGPPVASLIIIYDASYIILRIDNIWKTSFARLLIQILLIVLTTVVVVRWSIAGPIAQIAAWIRNLRTGKSNQHFVLPRGDILKPLADEVILLEKNMAIMANAEKEQERLMQSETTWTPEHLKEHVRHEIGERRLIVISNREPLMSVKKGGAVENIIPAGGLVTALDPVLKSCGGVWIAHGSGDADFETSDSEGKISIPPEKPAYTLRRVFLTKEEEQGYYYGFSNEGLWPLCHITHTRPTFRLEDWKHYQNVNQKFADTLLDEIKDETDPLVLIQDYHFALLPMLIREKRPDARIAIFWHIPWPNPEVFSICPWKQEILIGLLGCDLIGFHIQFHCNNFLETCDRFLESRINWEQFAVERHGRSSAVRPFPISVAAAENQEEYSDKSKNMNFYKNEVQKAIGFKCKYIGVGVDRIDYTKGIVERVKGVERFFEKHPEYIGQFTFIELGAPSRTHLKPYHDMISELDETIDRLNWKLQTKTWKPVVFLKSHHSHDEIAKYYKASEICLVTSLHDGMNLVAKEFVASRNDEYGVLVLSQFTGAARELHDSLIINPYNIEEIADAINTALNMPREEITERMRRMRKIVKERNVYKWAGNLVSTLSSMRRS